MPVEEARFSEPVSVLVTPDMKEAIERLAAEPGVTQGRVVRDWLSRGRVAYEKEVARRAGRGWNAEPATVLAPRRSAE